MSTALKTALGAAAAASLLAACNSSNTTSSTSSFDSNSNYKATSTKAAPVNYTLDNATGDAEVVAVAMHADWCKACTALAPKVSQAMGELNDNRIAILKADYTNSDNPAANATLARFGLTDLAEMNKGKTGIVYFVDAESGQVLGQLRGAAYSVDEIRTEMSEAITFASNTYAGVSTDG